MPTEMEIRFEQSGKSYNLTGRGIPRELVDKLAKTIVDFDGGKFLYVIGCGCEVCSRIYPEKRK